MAIIAEKMKHVIDAKNSSNHVLISTFAIIAHPTLTNKKYNVVANIKNTKGFNTGKEVYLLISNKCKITSEKKKDIAVATATPCKP